MRRLSLFFMVFVVALAAAAPSARAVLDPVAAEHYRVISEGYAHRVDEEGRAYFRALSRGEARTAPAIDASDRAAHPDLVELSDEQADIVRRGRAYARRTGDALFAQRVEIGAAHLAAMRYELAKGARGNRDLIWENLRASRSWICAHHLPDEEPAPVVIKAELEASPERIRRGECTTLRWMSEGATSVRIEPGVGTVPPNENGTREVCPRENTTYRIVAEGPGGREEKTDFVEVIAPAPLPEHLGRIHFDFDLWDIRTDAADTLAQVADFMRRHPEIHVSVEGHTDARASEEYNLPLSNRRAEAARDYLIERHGVSASRLHTTGLGKMRYLAPNDRDGQDYPEGRALNRRVEFRILRNR